LAAAALLFAASAAVAADTLRVGKSTLTSFSYTLLEVGMQSGIFRKHGLEIESSAFGGGPRLIQAMTADAIDVGLDGGTDMALIVKGAPMKAIAALSGAPLEMVIAVRSDSSIKSVADLKGKKIAVMGDPSPNRQPWPRRRASAGRNLVLPLLRWPGRGGPSA